MPELSPEAELLLLIFLRHGGALTQAEAVRELQRVTALPFAERWAEIENLKEHARAVYAAAAQKPA